MPVNVGFGSRVSRFKLVGLYPGSGPGNTSTELKYDVTKNVCVRKQSTSPWKRQAEAEEFAKNLGYYESLNKIRAEKERVKSGLGPGSYHIRRHTGRLTTSNKRDFGYAKRFTSDKIVYPGPGCYARKSSSVSKKRYVKPTFEWDGFFDRFKLPTAKTDTIPPNTYNPKDSGSIDAVLKRVVSRRGPYDLFTGRRDGSTIKNHFTPRQPEGADVFYEMESRLNQLLKHPRKRIYGDFDKMTGRTPDEKLLCGKDHQHYAECYNTAVHESPGPTTYNIDWHTIKPVEKSKYAFDSHRILKANHKPNIIFPGPGRYDVKFNMCIRSIPRKTKLKYLFESRRDKIARKLEEQQMLREQQRLLAMQAPRTNSTMTLYSQVVGNLGEPTESLDTYPSDRSLESIPHRMLTKEKLAAELEPKAKTKKKKVPHFDVESISNSSYRARKARIDQKVEERMMRQLAAFGQIF